MVVLPPRTVPAAAGEGGFQPWVEVTLVVRLAVPEWGVSELAFGHWAAPWEPERGSLSWRPFDPGRRAAVAGIPSGAEAVELGGHETEVLALQCAALLPGEMYYQPFLGMVSSLGESFAAFRHRCLKAVAQTVREALVRREPAAAQAVARVVESIERRVLGEGEMDVLEARVGLAYYPEGVEPGVASGNLMVEGGKGWRP